VGRFHKKKKKKNGKELYTMSDANEHDMKKIKRSNTVMKKMCWAENEIEQVQSVAISTVTSAEAIGSSSS
jgi:hypothetical protein